MFKRERDEEEGYREEILSEIGIAIRRSANSAFLRAALEFRELEEAHGEEAFDKIELLPPELEAFYDHRIDRIQKKSQISPN